MLETHKQKQKDIQVVWQLGWLAFSLLLTEAVLQLKCKHGNNWCLYNDKSLLKSYNAYLGDLMQQSDAYPQNKIIYFFPFVTRSIEIFEDEYRNMIMYVLLFM